MNGSASQSLTARLDRATIEGRIAWHVEQAANDYQRHLLMLAMRAVERVEAASKVAA